MRQIKVAIKYLANLPTQAVLLLIAAYQATLSPDHSWLKHRFPNGYCKFYPSCSQYTKEAVTRFGLLKGSYLGLKRVLKCHPWAESKVDMVPENF